MYVRVNFVKYDLRMSDLCVLSWARVQRVCMGSVSSVVVVCAKDYDVLRSVL